MELDILKQNTTWNDARASINNNFAKVKTALEQGGGTGGADLTEVNKKIAALTEETERLEADKQDVLVSGSNIKTINGQSILGVGNIAIEGGEEGGNTKIYTVYVQDSEQALESWKIEKNAQAVAAVQAKEDAIYVLEDSGGARIVGGGGAFGTGAIFSAYIISSTAGDFATIEVFAALLEPNGEILENGYINYNLTVPTEEQVEQMIADSIGSGGSITLDTEMSDTSTNAVSNKTIKKYVDDEAERVVAYAEGVANDAEAAAKKYTDEKIKNSGGGGNITVDDAISLTSENPVQNAVITDALDGLVYDYDLLTITGEQLDDIFNIITSNPMKLKSIICRWGNGMAKVEAVEVEGVGGLIAYVGTKKYLFTALFGTNGWCEAPWVFTPDGNNWGAMLGMANMSSLCNEARIEINGKLHPVVYYEGNASNATLYAVVEDKLNKYVVHGGLLADPAVMTLESSTPIGGGSGGSIDESVLDLYTPLVRDFSDDFNNDFTR